jgi:lipopolysaccharide biosynthesis protein
LTATAARLIAYYLPQFHPIPENDAWWGKGFTEWTNVAKAARLFPGHYQPHVPADLGFYDLRLPEVRDAQAALAREYGIEAFCYYHYWFAGKRLLERPFDEVLRSGRPDFPFCLCWANESWSGTWHGAERRMLIEQTYPGPDDHRRHFDALLPAFCDPRYVRVDGKPLFLIYQPAQLADRERTLAMWREMAAAAGLGGLHLVAVVFGEDWSPRQNGYDAAVIYRLHARRGFHDASAAKALAARAATKLLQLPNIVHYENAIDFMLPRSLSHDLYPTVIPNWDNTPRSGRRGIVLHGSSPALFARHVRHALTLLGDRPAEHRLVFVKSWNEWAEGNHLEPDLRYGHRYLQAMRDETGATRPT